MNLRTINSTSATVSAIPFARPSATENRTRGMMMEDECHQESLSFSDDSREDYSMERAEMNSNRNNNINNISSSSIFRDIPDMDYTPIEESNDTIPVRIPLSPAWSQESMEDIDDFSKLPFLPSNAEEKSDLCSEDVREPWSNLSSRSIHEISEMSLEDCGRVQVLNF